MQDTLIHQTTSLCRICKNGVPARVVRQRNNHVWMHKVCPAHGAQKVQLSTNADWYTRTRTVQPLPNRPTHVHADVAKGCPFDCGTCAQHEQKVRLPVVTITSACNLDCPICYVHNKNADAFHMETEEFRRILHHLVENHGGRLDLINFTGGDPTLHPDLLTFLEMSQQAGIHRVAVCTNGIKLVEDRALLQGLKDLDARIALAFDTFDPRADLAMQGAHMLDIKRECLDLLEAYGLDTTLIPVVTRGYNDHEIGDIIQMAMTRPNIRHVEVHTMTYTGQGGVDFPRSGRISMWEVLQRIEETTNGFLRPSDFVPSPCAHALCYQIAYVLMDPEGGPPVPFMRFMAPEVLYGCLSEHLYLEPSPKLERAMLDAIDQLWVKGGAESERTLRILKGLLRRMFPARPLPRAEALRVGELAVKAVYVHSHMDEETFDVARLAQCCDSACHADGSMIPVCAYNVLYREKQARFMTSPRAWGPCTGGERDVAGSVSRQEGS